MSSFDGQRGGGGGAPRTRKPHEPFAWLKGLRVGEDRSPPPRVFLRRQISVLSEEAGVT